MISSSSKKLITVIGARPQFIKAAAVSGVIREHPDAIREIIVHTGQHYDANMSDIFFEELDIPKPDYHLGIGGGSHGQNTGRMIEAIEAVLMQEKPDWVMVYGDTDSTLAGALAAVKLHIPVAHVEAGLRSFNKRMPEEINRILTDHISTLLFCPTIAAVSNLANEGITKGVHHVGDVMYDAALLFGGIAEAKSKIIVDLGLTTGEYYLATVHRAENTDDPIRLQSILSAFEKLDKPVIFPVHPRTRQKIADLIPSHDTYSLSPTAHRLSPATQYLPQFKNITFLDPVSFLDMVQLERNTHCILTDSGGVQKEAYFHGVSCVTLRDETEWVETVNAGWNQVVGADTMKIITSVGCAKAGSTITEYGQGKSSEQVLRFLFEKRCDG